MKQINLSKNHLKKSKRFHWSPQLPSIKVKDPTEEFHDIALVTTNYLIQVAISTVERWIIKLQVKSQSHRMLKLIMIRQMLPKSFCRKRFTKKKVLWQNRSECIWCYSVLFNLVSFRIKDKRQSIKYKQKGFISKMWKTCWVHSSKISLAKETLIRRWWSRRSSLFKQKLLRRRYLREQSIWPIMCMKWKHLSKCTLWQKEAW